MTETELAMASATRYASERDSLVRENERLRGLLAEVERRASSLDAGDSCPWCDAERGYPHLGCLAFTPSGLVR